MDWKILDRKFWPVAGVLIAIGTLVSGLIHGPSGAFVTFTVSGMLALSFKCTSVLVAVITGQKKPDIFTLFLWLGGKLTIWVLVGSAPFLFPKALGWPYQIGCFLYLIALFVTAFLAARQPKKPE